MDLQSSLVLSPKTSPAAKNRYLHIPGTTGLQLVPSSLSSLFSSPLSKILLPAILREPLRRANRPADLKDESVDVFLTRRFGHDFARTFGSAIGHGIYACDSRKLSVRAAFPTLWKAEERGEGSIVRGFFMKKADTIAKVNDYAVGDVEGMMKGVSVFSFQDGIRMIPDRLVRELKKNPKVNLQSGVEVTSLRFNPLKKTFEVRYPFLTKRQSIELLDRLRLALKNLSTQHTSYRRFHHQSLTPSFPYPHGYHISMQSHLPL